jgi:hypothetical protein
MLAEVVSEVGTGRLPDDPLGSPLFQRLSMLVRSPFPVEPSPPSWWSWMQPGLTTMVTLGAASLAILPASAARGPLPGRSAGSEAHSFELDGLEVSGAKALANGRAPRIELPIHLPSSFDLTVAIHATPSVLSRTRLAGQTLGAPSPAQSPSAVDSPAWHEVRLRVAPDGSRLTIDGRDMPLPPDRDPSPVWLTLEPPPDCDGQYRNLKLQW